MHRHLRLWACVILAAVCIACGSDDTPKPPTTSPGGDELVTGTERLGWIQTANAGDLPAIHFVVYVDGNRSELAGVSCQPTSDPSAFQCSAPLPPLSPGRHALELAAYIIEGDVLESPRSAVLQVIRATLAAAPPAPGPAVAWPARMAVATADGLQLRLDRIADGLSNPTDMAPAPDGRIFIAEESGAVRVLMPDGQLVAEPAATIGEGSTGTRLLSLALDARFEQTHIVYVLYASSSGGSRETFTLARFQEAANTLFAPIVLLDGVPAGTPAAGSVRVDADRTLFVALDDGGDARQAGDLSAPNGKVLRLTPDGTTPHDQAGLTPMYASELRSPRGFQWQPQSRTLWIADQVSEAAAVIAAIGAVPGPQRRGIKLTSYSLPRGTRPSSVAFYDRDSIPELRNNLLIASDEGQHLLRVRFDPVETTKVIGTERLLRNTIGGIRVVVVGAGGKVYLATSGSLATLGLAVQ